MRRAGILLAVLILASACVTSTPTTTGPQRTPLQIAELTYVQGSVFYEAAMTAIVELRTQHLITDAQWARVDAAQQIVALLAGEYSNLLNVWRTTGTKPAAFDETYVKMVAATTDIAEVLAEVKR